MKQKVAALVALVSTCCFGQSMNLNTPSGYHIRENTKFIALYTAVGARDGLLSQYTVPLSRLGGYLAGAKGVFDRFEDCDSFIKEQAFAHVGRTGFTLAKPLWELANGNRGTNPSYTYSMGDLRLGLEKATDYYIVSKHITLSEPNQTRTMSATTFSCSSL